jgi:hypothetical protein
MLRTIAQDVRQKMEELKAVCINGLAVFHVQMHIDQMRDILQILAV